VARVAGAQAPAAGRGQPIYEFQQLTFGPQVSRSEVRRTLAEMAEYGHWELVRVQLKFGGFRRIWVRRLVLRVRRTG
jgi:hypothetical protein